MLVIVSASNGQTPFCLPDADGDGHPLFGGTVVRAAPVEVPSDELMAVATSMASGDLDGDGDQDIVLSNVNGLFEPLPSSVSVFLNFGDGVFEDGIQYSGGPDARSVKVGDLDADGDLDVAVCNAAANTASVLFNAGTAQFGPRTVYAVGCLPLALEMVDLDGDGDLDLAVVNADSEDLSVLLNDGTGQFTPSFTFELGPVSSPSAGGAPSLGDLVGPFAASGDLDGDDDADLVIPAGSYLKVLWNDGVAAFSEPQLVLVGGSLWAVALGDLNSDDLLDFVAVSTGGTLRVTLNTGSGTFGPTVAYNLDYMNVPSALYSPTHVALGDLDHDSDLDVCVSMGDRNRGTART